MSYQVLKHPAGVVSCPAADPIARSATTSSTWEDKEVLFQLMVRVRDIKVRIQSQGG